MNIITQVSHLIGLQAFKLVLIDLRDCTKITWHKLSAKVPKRPDILLIECQVIFEPTLK